MLSSLSYQLFIMSINIVNSICEQGESKLRMSGTELRSVQDSFS